MRGWGPSFQFLGFHVVNFEYIRVKLTSSRVLQCASLHQVSQEFLHSSEIMCLVLCLIMVMHF